MEERVEDVLKKYDIEIQRAYRVRGAYVLETRQGIYLYKGYSGTETHAGYEAGIQGCLMERGFTMVDLYLPNREGQYLTPDVMGEQHVVKRWFLGEECSLRDGRDIVQAAETLARLHQAMKGMREDLPFEVKPHTASLEGVERRHLRELQRVRTYIRGKRERNPFEVRFLQCIEPIYEQGAEALEFLAGLQVEEVEQRAEQEGDFYHGSYTYHNLIMQRSGVAVVQYERAWMGLQLTDLYYLLRKTLEKNDWSFDAAEGILSGYQRAAKLTGQEKEILYAKLWFPDKFWKIANSYFNSRKSRIPGRNLAKLAEFVRQEERRREFLRRARGELFS